MASPPPPITAPGLSLVPALCAICKVEDADPLAVGEDFEYRTCRDSFLMVRCRRCGLDYLNPRPAECERPRIYPDNYHAFQFTRGKFGIVHDIRRRLEARRLLRWCRGLPPGARILDVGCGNGFHLEILRDYGKPGWCLFGVDIDARAVSAARSRGLTVQADPLTGLPVEPGYDLALMIMTIEHLGDPLAAVQEVARRLNAGGRLIIVTDNAGSIDQRIFVGRHWGGYHFPRHTYLFNRDTLRRLAEAAGLRTERITTAVSPVNWVYSIRNFLDDWDLPRWLVRQFSLSSVPALSLFTLLDMPLAALGRGAILQGIFRKT